MPDHDADLDGIVAMLSEAGLVEQVIDEGQPSIRLTAAGKQVAQQMALSSEDDAQVLLDALLDVSER